MPFRDGSPLDDGGLMSIIQTLFAKSDRSYGGNHFTELTANTFAGTHDNDDTTEDSANLFIAGGTSFLQYTFDSYVVVARPISFIRLRARVKSNGGNCRLVLRATNGASSAGSVALGVNTSFENFSFDVTTNPSTGLPWQPSEIDTTTFRVEMRMFNPGGPSTDVHCSEFFIEIWGGGNITGVTTYDLQGLNREDIRDAEEDMDPDLRFKAVYRQRRRGTE
jgi:hypothetical protein